MTPTGGEGLHTALVGFELAAAGVTFLLLSALTAPYGRHLRAGWGPRVPARAAWFLMESPAVFVFLGVHLAGAQAGAAAPLALLAVWLLHYGHRSVVYPLRMRSGAAMPAVVAGTGFAFNTLNAWVNARFTSHLGAYPDSWLRDPRFVGGVVLFLVGFVVNLDSDERLRRLRAPGDTAYRVPTGGLFRYVSCPNYLGELLEWAGWALATGSAAGLAFFLYTVANLVPRAAAHHRWYRATFPGYPRERRALLPGVW